MDSPPDATVVLIPIRSFDDGKSRLSDVLEPDERRRLTMRMAARVVAAAQELPVRVVTDDDGVVAWAVRHDVEVLPVGVAGLNPAVTSAVAQVAWAGFTRAIVAHADLPAADDLTILDRPGVCIAPDRDHDGSNVLSVPTGAGFQFAYGPGSFGRHVSEADRLGLPLTVVDDASLAWDVDDPTDLPDDWKE